MAFKTATVQTGKVASTQSNFPVYVDLDRLGITTLAEAQSVRVYADEAKTTEWAREIVSVSEMHVKVPSLTSSTEIFVDWDGVRSDYGVTTTYGRNAVWSDYQRVYHLNEASGAVVDSTGNDDGTNNGATTEAAGQIGDAYSFDGTNDVITGIATVDGLGNNVSYSLWVKGDSYSSNRKIALVNFLGGADRVIIQRSETSGRFQIDTYDGSTLRSHGTALTDTTNWHYFVGTTNTSKSLTSYLDGVAGTSSSYRGGGDSASSFNIGGDNVAYYWDGKIDEVRARHSILSANWITTEYNNQNAESTFWGTWTDAGGGGGGAAQAARRGAVMMM